MSEPVFEPESFPDKLDIAVTKHSETGTLKQPFFLFPYLYNLAFCVFALLYFPFFKKRLKESDDPKKLIRDRKGYLEASLCQKLAKKKVIWIHAVSVGEAVAVEGLLKELLTAFPDRHFLMTTVTPTGQKVAQRYRNDRVEVAYYPFDLTSAVKRVLDQVKPELILLVETELWPNFILEARRRAIPVGVVNARLSEKSLKGYASLGRLFGGVFKNLSFVLAQTREDAERFKKLGVRAERIGVAGNLKYDGLSDSSMDESAVAALKAEYGLNPDGEVILAGSTHPGEEEWLLNAYQSIKALSPHVSLVIAPRHVTRKEALQKVLNDADYSCVFTSDTDRERNYRRDFVLVVDEMGILKKLYALADVVVMGGSIVKHGGQNPVEPASYKKAIMHGINVMNFKQIYRTLDEMKGAIQFHGTVDFQNEMVKLLKNKQDRDVLGQNAYEAVRRMQGATRKHVDFIHTYLTQK